MFMSNMSSTHKAFTPEDIIFKLVVAGQGDHAAPGDAQGEEDLNAGIRPDLEILIQPGKNFI